MMLGEEQEESLDFLYVFTTPFHPVKSSQSAIFFLILDGRVWEHDIQIELLRPLIRTEWGGEAITE